MTAQEIAATLATLEAELPGITAYAGTVRTTVLDTVGVATVPDWYAKAQAEMCFDGQDFAYLP